MDLATTATYETVLGSLRLAGDSGLAVVPSGWGQGRATFGGLVVALALRAARERLPEPRPCRTLVASFPGPVAPGEVELRVHALRHGRAVSHLQVDVVQDGAVACVVLLGFGALRASTLTAAAAPAPAAGAPESLPPMIAAAGAAPEFTRHLEYRLAFGSRPYAGADAREIGGWCRFREAAAGGLASEEELVGLVDAWPSPAVARMAAPAPAASLTWSLELLAVEPEVPAGAWWLYRAELEACHGGYAHAAARLWSPGGRLAALSRQAVAVFA